MTMKFFMHHFLACILMPNPTITMIHPSQNRILDDSPIYNLINISPNKNENPT